MGRQETDSTRVGDMVIAKTGDGGDGGGGGGGGGRHGDGRLQPFKTTKLKLLRDRSYAGCR